MLGVCRPLGSIFSSGGGRGWAMIYGISTLKQRKAALPNGEEKMMGLSQAYSHIACRQMWSHAGPEGYKSSTHVELGHRRSATLSK